MITKTVMTEITKRFVLHIYFVNDNPITQNYDNAQEAIAVANRLFARVDHIYKIKLWDTLQGEITPNDPKAKALIQSWV